MTSTKRLIWILGLLLFLGTIFFLPSMGRVPPTATLPGTEVAEEPTDAPTNTDTLEAPPLPFFTATSEPSVIPDTETPTDVVAEPSLPAGIEFTDTPEGFELTVEPSSTPIGTSGISRLAVANALRVEGVTLVRPDGTRFIAAGINLETWRDKGCDYVTNGEYPVRADIADSIKALGVNLVRFNYTTAWLSEAGNLAKFMDMAQEFANRGVYVMPSDHTYTGKSLVNSSASFPLFGSITQAFRDRGIEEYLIWNFYNEPGGDPPITWTSWVAANKNALTYIRNTAGFQGVAVLDTRTWALDYDPASFDAMLAHDASLRGGAANLLFSQHYYPTNGMSPVDNAFANADKYPLMAGEIGQYNASPTDPQYVKDVISKWFNVARAKGHNGLTAWLWGFCDIGKMYEDWVDGTVAYKAPFVITEYGKLWRDNFYSKLSSNPPPQATAVAPTATRTPTRNTPLPTNTQTATRTVTPVASPTRTPTPPLEQWRITGKIGDMTVDLLFERIR